MNLSLFVLAVPLLLSCGQVEMPIEASILVEVTPGKPDAPTETIEVTHGPKAQRLTCIRRAADGHVISSAEDVVSRQDVARLWDIVERHRLMNFTPRETSELPDDFGDRRLRLVWRLDGEPESRTIDVSWQREIENRSVVEPLLRELATLAHRAGIELYYFPAPDRHRAQGRRAGFQPALLIQRPNP